jgi:hypothetical protein
MAKITPEPEITEELTDWTATKDRFLKKHGIVLKEEPTTCSYCNHLAYQDASVVVRFREALNKRLLFLAGKTNRQVGNYGSWDIQLDEARYIKRLLADCEHMEGEGE